MVSAQLGIPIILGVAGGGTALIALCMCVAEIQRRWRARNKNGDGDGGKTATSPQAAAGHMPLMPGAPLVYTPASAQV